MSIEAKNIVKKFGAFTALDNVSVSVQTGELMALLGPSGSGKTTLLRIIAGLEYADSGDILFHGKSTQNQNAKDRGVGFVFQHYGLFRHMTVFENIAFGLRVKPKAIRPSEERIKAKVNELLHLIQLDWVGGRFPSQLSGGQRQRIALARALAIEPKVLLLDEPFGALDAQVRKELRAWLRRLHDELHITSIFVTHDQEEALEVANKVVVMNKGRIEQVGTPEEVYHKPANAFVINFLGNVNLFHGRVVDGKMYFGKDVPEGKSAQFYIRPHQFNISRESLGENAVRAQLKYMNPAGSFVKLDLASESGVSLQIEITQQEYAALKPQKGEWYFCLPKNIDLYDFDI